MPSPQPNYTPLLASAASGLFDLRLAEEPVLRQTRLPSLQYRKAIVQGVDFGKREVRCEPSISDIAGKHLKEQHTFTLKYDKLIIAPGCDVRIFGTPGALEQSNFLRTTNDARLIQQRMLEMLDAATTPGISEEQQGDILRIIIVGGGAIGIEASAELNDLWGDEAGDNVLAGYLLLTTVVLSYHAREIPGSIRQDKSSV